jgi:hypothetical protein
LNANEDIKLEKLKISQQIARQNWGAKLLKKMLLEDKNFNFNLYWFLLTFKILFLN